MLSEATVEASSVIIHVMINTPDYLPLAQLVNVMCFDCLSISAC
jgi:hypothetical protein